MVACTDVGVLCYNPYFAAKRAERHFILHWKGVEEDLVSSG